MFLQIIHHFQMLKTKSHNWKKMIALLLKVSDFYYKLLVVYKQVLTPLMCMDFLPLSIHISTQ